MRRYARIAAALAVVAVAAGCSAAPDAGGEAVAAPVSAATTAPVSAPAPVEAPGSAEGEAFDLGVPYGALGWDVSYPQCNGALPEQREFAVVGMDGELPIDVNPCFAEQADWAEQSGGPQLWYVNAANPAGLGTATWPRAGSNRYGECSGGADEACSYQYGADRAAEDLATAGGRLRPGAVIFIVVEREFSWEDGEQTPQTRLATLEGMADAYREVGVVPGIYSTAEDWRVLMGELQADHGLYGLPIWLRDAANLDDAKERCQLPSFTGGKIVLSQVPGSRTASGLDENVAC